MRLFERSFGSYVTVALQHLEILRKRNTEGLPIIRRPRYDKINFGCQIVIEFLHFPNITFHGHRKKSWSQSLFGKETPTAYNCAVFCGNSTRKNGLDIQEDECLDQRRRGWPDVQWETCSWKSCTPWNCKKKRSYVFFMINTAATKDDPFSEDNGCACLICKELQFFQLKESATFQNSNSKNFLLSTSLTPTRSRALVYSLWIT